LLMYKTKRIKSMIYKAESIKLLKVKVRAIDGIIDVVPNLCHFSPSMGSQKMGRLLRWSTHYSRTREPSIISISLNKLPQNDSCNPKLVTTRHSRRIGKQNSQEKNRKSRSINNAN